MTNSRTTRKALVSSALAVLMCMAMLIGTTFAWFTDTASTPVNKIQAGELKVDIVDKDGNSLNGKTLSFRNVNGETDILWEPGATFNLDSFKIVNNGNLALTYKVIISGVNGSAKLLDAIDFTMKKGDAAATAVEGWEGVLLPTGEISDKYDVGGTDLITITGKMKEDAGNEYQGLSIDGISITVVAKQFTYEKDSIDDQYDKDAAYLNTDAEGNILIGSAGDLRYFAATVNADTYAYAGKTIKLTSDIDLGGTEWVPINIGGIVDKEVTFDGNGKTVSNFKVTETEGEKFKGFFGSTIRLTVKNLTIDNATVTGIGHVGAIVGHGQVTTIDGCTVKNSSITTSVYKNDDGDKAGAIAGWLEEGAVTVTNCTVEKCTVTGYRDIGGLVGYVGIASGGVPVVSNNTVKETKVIQNLVGGYQSTTPITVEQIVGRKGNGFTLDTTTNTATNVTIEQITE